MILSKWNITASDFYQKFRGNYYSIHQAICNIFDESSIKFDVTINGNMVNILIQSTCNIVNKPMFGEIMSKEVSLDNFSTGTYRLVVNLNAVRQQTLLTDQGKKKRTKIPVVGDAIEGWIESRASQWGIECKTIAVKSTVNRMSKKKNHKISCKSHNVIITCAVTCESLFRNMISNGIGHQKAFGCGLVKVFKLST